VRRWRLSGPSAILGRRPCPTRPGRLTPQSIQLERANGDSGIQERSYPPHCSTSQRHMVDAADRHQDEHREEASPCAGRLHAQDIGVQAFPGEPLPAISLLANHQDRHPPLDDCPSTDSPAAQLTFAPGDISCKDAIARSLQSCNHPALRICWVAARRIEPARDSNSGDNLPCRKCRACVSSWTTRCSPNER
jgi:hypothetical protein